MKTEVYLVGNEKSEALNQWLAMTNSKEEAARLLTEIDGACTMKTIEVKGDNRGRN